MLDLAELAVTRRGELVANVTAAADLTRRSAPGCPELLARMWPPGIGPAGDRSRAAGRPADQRRRRVIDGSLSSRLAAARTSLPD